MTQIALRSFIDNFYNHFPEEIAQSTVGFDRLFNDVLTQLSHVSDIKQSYPPHNIRRVTDKENVYALDIAVAGFKPSDIEVSVEKQVLTIKGTKPSTSDKDVYVYRGLAMRSFEKHIPLVDTAEVIDARLEDGILTILVQNVVPEKSRKKVIPVGDKTPMLKN